jgi:hypothetical protein
MKPGDWHEREPHLGTASQAGKNECLAALAGCVAARKLNACRLADSPAIGWDLGRQNKNCCPDFRAAAHPLSWPAEAQAFETPAISSTRVPLLGNTGASGWIFQKSYVTRQTTVRSGCGSGLIGCPTGLKSFLKEMAIKPRIVGSRLMQAA